MFKIIDSFFHFHRLIIFQQSKECKTVLIIWIGNNGENSQNLINPFIQTHQFSEYSVVNLISDTHENTERIYKSYIYGFECKLSNTELK